ncbi:hypothetical protein [Dyella koreensis]|uniref:O-antigen ligase domain-containing protein n=1 Tax=Dyella koreensis TaxID=311235 RepID=A0ABW8KAL2_9GAMM
MSASAAPAPLPPSAPMSAMPVNERRLTLRHVFLGSAMLLLFLTVVVPNSLPVPTAAMMGITTLMALPGLRLGRGFKKLLALLMCSSMVTVIYIAVGYLNDAPPVAAAQVLVIYILSPLLWMVISDGLLRWPGSSRLMDWFAWLSVLACISVGLYFYLYLTYGAAAVSFFFKGQANVNLNEGFSGAIMHVYGSLIFLAGGFFSSPELIKSRLLRLTVLAMLLVCALTSGRSALILAIPVGWVLGQWLTPRTLGYQRSIRTPLTRLVKVGLPTVFAIALVVVLLESYTSIRLSVIYDSFMDKLTSGGGTSRVGMAGSLFEGILDNGGIGAGHGIGVSFVSSQEYPWRYELVWLATVYRVGLVGALVYALPFLLYIARVLRMAAVRKLPPQHKFLFCAFVAAFIASNTNPYIEAFAFQWMYTIPVLALFVEYPMGMERGNA